ESPPGGRMPLLEVDDDVYQFLLRQTSRIGEDASSILRRLHGLPDPGGSGSDTGTFTRKDDQPDELEVFLASGRFVSQRDVTSRYLSLLSFLAQKHGKEFEKVLTIRGRRRVYFGSSYEEVDRSGKSVYPQRIPGTDYWAM